MGSKRLPLAAVVIALWLPFSPGAQQPSPQNAFTIRDASRLISQIATALEGHQMNKFMAAFDLSRMSGGELFRQQIASLFAHADSIRVHLNVSEAAMNGDRGTASLEAEMETAPPDDNTPPVRKHATLRFTAERVSSGWKFTDVDPRDFFSTAPAPGASPSK